MRKIIRITAEDSPNVQFARAEIAAGKVPSDRQLLEGVLSWSDYVIRRATYPLSKQLPSLDAKWDEGAISLLWPPHHIAVGQRLAAERKTRGECYLGVDCGEGGDDTSHVVTDDYGEVRVEADRTPDTNVITGHTLALCREFNIHAKNVVFDRGGGGKEHADRLKAAGWPVRYIGFGDGVEDEGDDSEEKETYFNLRSQLYWEASYLSDPTPVIQKDGTFLPRTGYAVANAELIRQMELIPRTYDDEGRCKLLKKRSKNVNEVTLTRLLGKSPNELDAFVCSVYARLHPMDPTAFLVARRKPKAKTSTTWIGVR